MTSNVSDNCNKHEKRNETEEYSFDASIVEKNTSPDDCTVSECELNETKNRKNLKLSSKQQVNK